MQIQRIQTLWLILALGCMVVFIVLPFGTLVVPDNGAEATGALHSWDFIGLIIPVGLAALFHFIAIFSYKTPALQRSVAILGLMMVLVSIGITVYVLCAGDTFGTTRWTYVPAFLAGALVFNILALVGINHDIKLLKSYDRLR